MMWRAISARPWLAAVGAKRMVIGHTVQEGGMTTR